MAKRTPSARVESGDHDTMQVDDGGTACKLLAGCTIEKFLGAMELIQDLTRRRLVRLDDRDAVYDRLTAFFGGNGMIASMSQKMIVDHLSCDGGCALTEECECTNIDCTICANRRNRRQERVGLRGCGACGAANGPLRRGRARAPTYVSCDRLCMACREKGVRYCEVCHSLLLDGEECGIDFGSEKLCGLLDSLSLTREREMPSPE